MKKSLARRDVAALLAAVAISSCSTATQQSMPGRRSGVAVAASVPPTKAHNSPLPHSAADVYFMSGMIPHHAQAVLIAGWAATHGARSDVRILCERIVVGQRDEIAMMQRWLREQNEPVPAADATHMKMQMNGMAHDMLMPGMLNDAELLRLDSARGADFDRLFLMAMIAHHRGAITMVDQLFGSNGAAQDEDVFRFASDVYADQTTEIDRMQKMLATVTSTETHK